jgi:DNA polymerase III epsilon subunit-like protein
MAADKPKKIIAISLDTETTGLGSAAKPPQPVSISWHGLGELPNLSVLESFEELFDVTEPISLQAQQIHGISKAMIQGKPVWSSMAQLKIPETAQYMICHNADFDWGKVLGKPKGFKVICTMKLAKALMPIEKGCSMSPSGKFRSYKLVDLCSDVYPEKRDFIFSGAHGSSHDAKLTILLLHHFVRNWEIQSWEDLFELQQNN